MIYHLIFADDLLLFAEASVGQIGTVTRAISRFCAVSRQRVSAAKTMLYFSRNVSNQMQREIHDICNYSVTEDLGRYLGVPLVHGRIRRGHSIKSWKKLNYALIASQP